MVLPGRVIDERPGCNASDARGGVGGAGCGDQMHVSVERDQQLFLAVGVGRVGDPLARTDAQLISANVVVGPRKAGNICHCCARESRGRTIGCTTVVTIGKPRVRGGGGGTVVFVSHRAVPDTTTTDGRGRARMRNGQSS